MASINKGLLYLPDNRKCLLSLQIQHIAKAFGEKTVLQDVSFELGQGQIKVLMGTNGSGKTTLFNIITGFLKADNGKVLLHSKRLNDMARIESTKKVLGEHFKI